MLVFTAPLREKLVPLVEALGFMADAETLWCFVAVWESGGDGCGMSGTASAKVVFFCVRPLRSVLERLAALISVIDFLTRVNFEIGSSSESSK